MGPMRALSNSGPEILSPGGGSEPFFPEYLLYRFFVMQAVTWGGEGSKPPICMPDTCTLVHVKHKYIHVPILVPLLLQSWKEASGTSNAACKTHILCVLDSFAAGDDGEILESLAGPCAIGAYSFFCVRHSNFRTTTRLLSNHNPSKEKEKKVPPPRHSRRYFRLPGTTEASGNMLSILRKAQLKDKEMRVLMLGLDNAGKTTIVKHIMEEDVNTVSPTLGFIIKTVDYKG